MTILRNLSDYTLFHFFRDMSVFMTGMLFKIKPMNDTVTSIKCKTNFLGLHVICNCFLDDC